MTILATGYLDQITSRRLGYSNPAIEETEAYINNVRDLAKSMILKSKDEAGASQLYVQEVLGSAPYNPLRYYLNLEGKPFEGVDEDMYITDPDGTKQLYNKDMFENDLSLRNKVKNDIAIAKDLISRYPAQEVLIRGIANPVNGALAEAAKDDTILYYDKSLVEEHEYTLIQDLQQELYSFNFRWKVEAYGLSDALAPAIYYQILFNKIVGTIINLRNRRIKTNEAHSFHIKMSLDSSGRLTKYYKYLDRYQAMWLYTNLEYILKRKGHQATMESLIDVLFNYRGFSISGYNYNKTKRVLAYSNNGKMEDNYVRETLGEVEPLGADVSIPLIELHNKYLHVSPNNYLTDIRDLEKRTASIHTNSLYTKYINSELRSTGPLTQYDRKRTVVSMFGYLALTTRYISTIDVDLGQGLGSSTMSTKRAYVILNTLICKLTGELGERVPTVLKLENVMVTPQAVSGLLPKYKDAMSAILEPASSYTDPVAFIDAMEQMHRDREAASIYARSITDQLQRALAIRYVDNSFTIRSFSAPYGGSLVSSFLLESGIDLVTLSDVETVSIIESIAKAFGGIDLSEDTILVENHKAMVDLLRTLLSYNVVMTSTSKNIPTIIVDGDIPTSMHLKTSIKIDTNSSMSLSQPNVWASLCDDHIGIPAYRHAKEYVPWFIFGEDEFGLNNKPTEQDACEPCWFTFGEEGFGLKLPS